MMVINGKRFPTATPSGGPPRARTPGGGPPRPGLQIKASVVAVLRPEEGVVLREALDQLAAMPLEAAQRWRVNQIEHALCEKPGIDEDQLDEP